MLRSFIAVFSIAAGLVSAQELKPIALPAPQTAGGKPLMDVLKQRQSLREYSPEKFSPQVLSNLLWAAWGINRPDGRRTAPSASNRQEVEIYALLPEGAYLWDAKANVLNPVVTGDIRKATGSQAFALTAPLDLAFVADFAKVPGNNETTKMVDAGMNTGFISQNIYLFCASEGLATVVRGSVPREELGKALKLRPQQHVTYVQVVGYPKK